MTTATLTKVLYTAEATVKGGRTGHATSSDGRLDVDLSAPSEMGGAGGSGTNPEQLFAAGYAACFQSALLGVAKGEGLDLSDSEITGRVGIGPTGHGGFGIQVELVIDSPALPSEQARELIAAAHARCPYSNATRGNVDVTFRFGGAPLEL
ncbi:MAG: lipoyl-dependent peroxiredoxin [Gaiellales bacterium]|jgi:Ohr subfamily peroxiredoxin|nr:lipoyl-dependent peroxiredoxin [Gaiellales bacterium]MDX6546276.1 lipoyl-dependent peroxiredoxin [Gaiellales bacterium]MDX6549655.1 lipoyl-dependent peroxiredoxin [Gaiellales bacterium]